jgi:predicted metal-dependent enzyme (double-stranded beta helix superfamily)
VEELVELVQSLARQEHLWRPLVHHDPEARRYASLYVDEHVGIWVISWMPGHDTGLHDHDGSQGAVAVVEGEIRSDQPTWGSGPRSVDVPAGSAFGFDGAELHRMVDATDGPAVTIHAYSPPLRSMGMYREDDDGAVRRRAVGWDEHLDA